MRIGLARICTVALGLCACNQATENGPDANRASSQPQKEVAPSPAPASAAQNASNVTLPDDRAPLEEPRGPIDPESAEAAGQIVQHYGAMIEQRRWIGAKALWGDAAAADRFRADLAGYSEMYMEIGKPGDAEGAAGSIYTTVPAIFYGKTNAGGSFRRAAKVILRRVNDVPGSTDAQRRWHIERIEWSAGG